jgi:TRAP-type mannitol/chloroaromatic compound transport system permease small subunit
MRRLISIVDGFSSFMVILGRSAIALLVIAMLYEVLARYVFDAPTLWAFDISYMLNGSIFILGAAYALKQDAHVRIDFLSQKLPLRVQQIQNGILYILIMAPIFGMFTYISGSKTLKAFLTGELESVSPWAPVVWPFYFVIALGLFSLSLQFLAEGLKYLSGQIAPGQLELDSDTNTTDTMS